MKLCSVCEKYLPESDFGWKQKSKNLLQSACKPCTRTRYNKWYSENAEKTIADTRRRARVEDDMYKAYKLTLSCVVCGESAPECIDFHHVDAENKSFQVSRNTTLKRRLEEAAKCIPICANCHRKHHAGNLDLTAYMPH